VPSYRLFIDGRWSDAADGRTFQVLEPYTREPYAEVAAGGRQDAERAIAAAAAAFEEWAALAPAAKRKLFQRAADVVERRRTETAEALIAETGCSAGFAGHMQDAVQTNLHHAASWVYEPRGEVLGSDYPGTFSTAVRRPLGVVASITPWNGGSVLPWRSVISPLAAGNTVVVKPSEESPVTAGLLVAEALEEAGFPAGVVNVVPHAPGEAAPIADAFYESDDVRCINFIGSVATGRMLAERAGRTLKRSVMELGGFNPLLVLDDADVDYAAVVASLSAFFHQGQICLNVRKALVARAIYEPFVEKLVAHARTLGLGDPHDPATIVGPLINERALAVAQERIAEAVQRGAHVVAGGGAEGLVMEPTVLVDVPDDATVAREETFAPLLVVRAVEDDEEALTIANEPLYGLTAAVLAGDRYRGFEVAQRLRAGSVHVNTSTLNDELHAPIGGVRDSGWGRSGPQSIDDFSDVVWLTVEGGRRPIW
jgi:acyl-CoA reductase-like NAD-dependent aldehyde dehydrogenase